MVFFVVVPFRRRARGGRRPRGRPRGQWTVGWAWPAPATRRTAARHDTIPPPRLISRASAAAVDDRCLFPARGLGRRKTDSGTPLPPDKRGSYYYLCASTVSRRALCERVTSPCVAKTSSPGPRPRLIPVRRCDRYARVYLRCWLRVSLCTFGAPDIVRKTRNDN